MDNETKLKEFQVQIEKLCDEFQIDLTPALSIRAVLRSSASVPEVSKPTSSNPSEITSP